MEEVNASDLSSKYRSHQVYPYDRRYARQGDQAEDQYSLNVLNLEGETETSTELDCISCHSGESLANSFNSRYSRHSYENNFQVGAGKRSKQSESGSQTVPEMIDEVNLHTYQPEIVER